MVEKQASACTCHCILRYCNETDFIYHDRCETFCHLRVCLLRFVKLSMLCSAGPTCPHLPSTVSLMYVCMAYAHVFAYNRVRIVNIMSLHFSKLHLPRNQVH